MHYDLAVAKSTYFFLASLTQISIMQSAMHRLLYLVAWMSCSLHHVL